MPLQSSLRTIRILCTYRTFSFEIISIIEVVTGDTRAQVEVSINQLLRALRLTCPHEYQESTLCFLRMYGNMIPRKAIKLCTTYSVCDLTIVKLRPRYHNDIIVKIKLQPQA